MNTLKLFFTLYFFFLTLGFNCHANEENNLSYQHGIAMHGDLKYKKISQNLTMLTKTPLRGENK